MQPDAELCNHQQDATTKLINKVLENARSAKDKVGVYVVKLNSLWSTWQCRGCHPDGWHRDYEADVANLCTLIEIVKTRLDLWGRSNTSLLTLPSMRN